MAFIKGLRSLAIGFLPAKSDSKIQKEFLQTTLKPECALAQLGSLAELDKLNDG